LIIGIYKMNETNTKIGKILSNANLEYIPEAHCYLKVNDKIIDATTNSSNFDNIKNDIIEKIEIEPYQVADFKVEYHQNFIKSWLTRTKSAYTFDKIWKIREECINHLSNVNF
jgi:hypothetical protein